METHWAASFLEVSQTSLLTVTATIFIQILIVSPRLQLWLSKISATFASALQNAAKFILLKCMRPLSL